MIYPEVKKVVEVLWLWDCGNSRHQHKSYESAARCIEARNYPEMELIERVGLLLALGLKQAQVAKELRIGKSTVSTLSIAYRELRFARFRQLNPPRRLSELVEVAHHGWLAQVPPIDRLVECCQAIADDDYGYPLEALVRQRKAVAYHKTLELSAPSGT